MKTTILVHSDHEHDQKTRRSLTGWIAFVGSILDAWYIRRQGTVASSTYAAEFSTLLTATEKAEPTLYPTLFGM